MLTDLRTPLSAPAPATDPLVEPDPPRPAAAPGQPSRLDLIDRLRGLVIVLMVLDHVREYFSAEAFAFEATDLARTTPAIFATRWVTHLCAPTFVFLAGVAVYLQREGASDRSRVARFLVTRGLWLIVLELTAISFALDFSAPFFFFQVIWAIGIGMVLLAPLLWLPPRAVLALGALIVAGHGALPSIQPADLGALATPWRLLMALGPTPPLPGFVAYPALPWFGVLCLGYGLGSVFTRPEADRRRTLAALGAGALALFVLLRALNGYGDPAPWAVQPRGAVYTALSFLKVSKYPPSLLFVLVTLGVSLPLGLALERARGPVSRAAGRVLLAFGRTPLFTYLLHIYLVHGAALAIGVALGLPAAAFTHYVSEPERIRAVPWGFSLPAVYAFWLATIALLYPVARWYAAYKQRRRAWWMRYL